MKVPVDKISQFEEDFLHQLELKNKDILDTLKAGKLNDEILGRLESLAKELATKYKV